MVAAGAFIAGSVVTAGVGMLRHDGWDKQGGEYRAAKEMHDMMQKRDDERGRGTMSGMDMNDTTMDGMHAMHGTGMMVETEREFITAMIPHHEEAVATAKEVVARGGSTPEIKALAEGIIMAQEAEIVDMKDWYQTWYGVAYESSGTYVPMMRPLTALSGTELDRVFLTDMIMHHMGAIMMAESVQSHIEHQEMTDLTAAIKTTQTAEIVTMKSLLVTLN